MNDDVVTVETQSRWETSSLLHKLRGCGAYAIQLEHGRWLVRSVADESKIGTAAIQLLIAEWAREEGAHPRAIRVGDAIVPLTRD
ncbi:MAG: hypothetical protein HOQ03_09515 [Thermoleophilia bacterium]|nr:hypothetical protein [Thermoleophilia bacterium]